MRLFLALCVLGLPAHAGCFTQEELPAKAVYDTGSALEYLGQEGGVLTYRSGETTTRMKHGLWPLDHVTGQTKSEYRWDGLLPDLARVIVDGGKARVEGRLKHHGGDWQPVVIEVEVLAEAFFDWEDCRYQVIEFRKTMQVAGKKVSEGVVLYAPAAMIAFRTDQTDPASGTVTSVVLKALN
jgi:hypothetical protein